MSCGDPHLNDFVSVDDVPHGTNYEAVFKMLELRIIALEDELMLDRAMRQQYPALQDLYEKYKATKKLVASKS